MKFQTIYHQISAIVLTSLLQLPHATGAEQVSLSGTIHSVACATACGICCSSHVITDTSGTLSLPLGNAFVDIGSIIDNGEVHQITGHFYNTAGQCGIGACTAFAVEAIDTPRIPAASYDPANGRLSIQAVVINGTNDTSYDVTLEEPFTVTSALDNAAKKIILQGGDCSANNAVCSSGTVCLAYFGIAGSNGPEFKTCETPCSHPGASCPLGQSCGTIADGPGQVCTVD